MQSRFFFLVLVFFLIVTCSTIKNNEKMGKEVEPKKTTTTQSISIESKQLASEQETNFVAEVTFPEGKKNVDKEARANIKRLFLKAKEKGDIEEVKIVTWGDKEYPGEEQGHLSREQMKLVEDRNDNLESYLEKLDFDMKVDKFSMADRPEYLERLFSNDDARIKKSLEEAGIATDGERTDAPEKNGTSIVMFIVNEDEVRKN